MNQNTTSSEVSGRMQNKNVGSTSRNRNGGLNFRKAAAEDCDTDIDQHQQMTVKGVKNQNKSLNKSTMSQMRSSGGSAFKNCTTLNSTIDDSREVKEQMKALKICNKTYDHQTNDDINIDEEEQQDKDKQQQLSSRKSSITDNSKNKHEEVAVIEEEFEQGSEAGSQSVSEQQNLIERYRKALLEVIEQNSQLKERVEILQDELVQAKSELEAKDEAIVELSDLLNNQMSGTQQAGMQSNSFK